MAKDKAAKTYKRLMDAESEYKAFLMIERLDPETSKEVLFRVISNRIRKMNLKEMAN